MWRDIDHDERQADRDRVDLPRGGAVGVSGADRSTTDPRDVCAGDLALPRAPQREPVRVHAHTYELRGADARTLATVGAFRVVPESDLRRQDCCPRDLRRLQELGLVRTQPYVVGKDRTKLVVLTDRGRDLLECARRAPNEHEAAAFYAGLSKPRERAHAA